MNHFNVPSAAGTAPRSANGPGDCANRGTCTARDGLRGGVFAVDGVGATATSAGFFAFLFVGVFGDLAPAAGRNRSPPIHSPPELGIPEDVAGASFLAFGALCRVGTLAFRRGALWRSFGRRSLWCSVRRLIARARRASVGVLM